MTLTFTDLIGAIGFMAAMAVLAYITISTDGATRDVALGGIIAVAAGGKEFFLRGRVQAPTP